MMSLSNMIVLRRSQVWRGRRAFTLVELMVAVALVLVLILGVNEVFRLTSDTINVGQNLSNATRDQRAVRQTMEEDFSHIASDAPAMIITNKVVAAYRSKEEEQADASLKNTSNALITPQDPKYRDLNGDGVITTASTDTNYVTGEAASPATPDSRMRRVDTITMFVRQPNIRRQTPNYLTNNTLTPPETLDMIGSFAGTEAMVTYGHLRLPDNASTPTNAVFFEPGEPDQGVSGNKTNRRNDNNRYYTQWILGRSAILMAPSEVIASTESRFTGSERDTAGQVSLTPLSMRTNVNNVFGDAVNGTTAITSFTYGPSDSVLDLAAISMSDFGTRLARYIRDAELASASYQPTLVNDGRWYMPAESDAYFDPGHTGARGVKETLSYRYNGNPTGIRGTKNDLAMTLSQTAPVMVPRCTSFVVEFAGDFITQDANPNTGSIRNLGWGRVTAAAPDGVIDFVVANGQRRIRWYGLPRYDGGASVLTGSGYRGPVVRGRATSASTYNIVNGEATSTPDENVSEVVPVSDILHDFGGVTGTRNPNYVASFEKVVMTSQTVPATPPSTPQSFYDINTHSANLVPTDTGGVTNFLPVQQNYADPSGSYTLQRANYVCAWSAGDNKPKLIRITMTLEDVKSRNGGAQTYQYVFPIQ